MLVELYVPPSNLEMFSVQGIYLIYCNSHVSLLHVPNSIKILYMKTLYLYCTLASKTNFSGFLQGFFLIKITALQHDCNRRIRLYNNNYNIYIKQGGHRRKQLSSLLCWGNNRSPHAGYVLIFLCLDLSPFPRRRRQTEAHLP